MEDEPIKVLLVEDNPGDTRLMREMLAEVKNTPFNLECVDRLSTGLERLAAGDIDVVLLDLSLPDSLGVDTFVKAKAQAPEAPIIVLTGLDDETVAAKAVREGAQDYLVKGQVNSNLLARAIRYAIERKRTEEALRTSVREWQTTFDAISDAVYILDMESRILRCNKATTDILGKSPNEIIGHTCWELVHGTSEPIEGCPFVSMWETHHRETMVLPMDNQYFNIAVDPLLDEAGNLTGGVHIITNITEQMQAEETLQETNRRLEAAVDELKATQQQVIQQERLRALGQMASGIAHDFNNALTPILGYSELLLMAKETLEDKEKVKYYLKLINTGAKDAGKIISRLREFYRHREKSEVFVPVNPNRLVKQAIDLTQPKWRDQALANGITINISTDLQDIPDINGNEAELREVLANLILNAVDAMPTSGTITIRTRLNGKRIVIEVSDTGVGMTEEVRQRCFEPFFSTKSEGGTGLGLSVVHGIIQRHKGTIEIESEEGKGTTFIISLPLMTEQRDKERTHKKESHGHTLHVLVVEDEPLVRDIITKYLTTDGYTVETATNGREGLEMFYAGSFDLVVMNKAMPDMSGVQLADDIKRMAPNKPVIMLTGFGEIMKASDETPASVDYIVSKPVTLDAFREALTKVTALSAPS